MRRHKSASVFDLLNIGALRLYAVSDVCDGNHWCSLSTRLTVGLFRSHSVTVSLFTHCLTSPGHSALSMAWGASPLLTKSSIKLCGVHRLVFYHRNNKQEWFRKKEQEGFKKTIWHHFILINSDYFTAPFYGNCHLLWSNSQIISPAWCFCLSPNHHVFSFPAA